MTTVLVIGGSGFLGRRVVPRLLRSHEVVCTVRSGAASDAVVAMGAMPVAADLDDPASLDRAFERAAPDILVNLASLGFGHAPTIVAAAEAAFGGRAVFVSTTAIFTRLPAAAKAVRVAAEDEIRGSTLAWTIVRPTMIYGGPDDRNVSRLLALLRRTPVVPVPGGGRCLQQPVHVDDLADTIVGTLARDLAIGQAYDVPGPEPITLRRMIEEAAVAVGRRSVLVPVPLGPVTVLAGAYERVASVPRLKQEQLLRLAEDKAFDVEPAHRDLGHSPRSFADGVAEMVEPSG